MGLVDRLERIERERERRIERERRREREKEREGEKERDVHILSSLPQLVPEDEPTSEQNQQQIMRLLHSLISQPAPTIPPPPSAPVYSMGGTAQRAGSTPLQAPVLTSPSPPIAGGGGNAPLANIYGHQPSNARVIEIIKLCLIYAQLGHGVVPLKVGG